MLTVDVPSPEIGASVVAATDEECAVTPSCSICMAKPRTVRNRPCGHAICCGLCTVRAVTPSRKKYFCPACRAEVEELEWHGASPNLSRMATDGRQLSPGAATRSSVHEFLRARAEDDPESELGAACRQVLAVWGIEGADVAEAFPLIAACESGDAAAVTALLAAGSDANLSDGDGWTPLIAAASEGNAQIVATLLAVPGIDANARNDDGETALMRAAASGSTQAAAALLTTAQLDVNGATHVTGKTALVIAASVGDAVMAALLLSAPDIDANATDALGDTALLHAATLGHVGVVRVPPSLDLT
jgi:hypothetical protein